MQDAQPSPHRLNELLAKTTRAAFAASTVEGADIYGQLAEKLADILGVSATMIATELAERPGYMLARATWLDGRRLKPFEYDLAQTPCRAVVGQPSHFVAAGVHKEFTPGSLFHAKGFDSYAARSLVDSSGRHLGQIVAMDRAPMRDAAVTEAVLQIFAVRASAEYERERSQAALQASEASYRAIFEANEDAIFVHDWASGAILDVSPKASELYGYPREALRQMRVGDISANVAPYTEREAVAHIEQAKRQERPLRIEWRARHRDGHLMWHEVTLKRAEIAGERRVLAFVRDITEGRRAGDAIRASEAQYRTIFNASVDAMVLWDSELRRVDINPAYERLFGVTREQVLAGMGFEHLPLEYTEYRRRLVQRTLAGERCHAELESVRSNGRPLHVEVHTVPIQHGGRPHVLAIVRDISQRREQDEDLRRSEGRLRATVEAALDAVIGMDAAGNVIEFNAAAERCFGLRRADVLGKPLAELVIPQRHRQRHVAGMEHYLRTGEGPFLDRRVEVEAMRADGSEFPAELAIGVAQSREGPIFIGYLRDITERRRAEERLRASEEQYRVIFDGSADALALWNRDILMVDVNAAMTEMYGYARDEVVGKSYTDRMPREAVEKRIEMIRRALAGEQGQLETIGVRKNGERFDVELRFLPIDYRGEPHVLVTARDITARKRAEQALRASEEQYRAIFDGSADAVALWDREVRIVDVNAAFTTMYRYTREEVVGKSYSDSIPRDAVEKRLAVFRRALAGEPGQLETIGVKGDGEYFDVELRFLPIDVRGAPHVLVIARDITERKRTEQALRASEEQYRAIFNATDDALVLRDADFRVVDVNAAYEAMSGLRRAEVIGVSELTLTRYATAIDRRALHAEALAGRTVHFEAEGRRVDGAPLLLEVRGIPMIYRSTPHVLYIGRDATERRAAEAALRASEEQHRAIFNASADALVLRDADFRIVDVNATYEAMTGRSREDVLGADRVLANPPEVNETIRPLHQKALAGEPIVLETQLVRRDGARYDLELRGVPIRHRGAPHVLYMGRDITARRRAEDQQRELQAQLRQVQKMEAIGQLTGGIAHDFNNILAAIMGYVGLAQERPNAVADAKLAEYLEQAEQGCRRARDLIQQMLAFSRGRRGERRALPLPTLIEESLRLLRATFPSSIALQLESADDEAVAEVDPVQLQQVLLNLGINARDAVGGAGSIRFGVRRGSVSGICASCGQQFGGSFHRLWVADSGPGISPQLRNRIFEPFFSTKAPGRGTGMGLATVHRIAHEHGGHVLVDSDHGARFEVLLPAGGAAAVAEPTAAKAAPAPGPDRLRGRVLLVDDEESVLGFMRELMQSWGLDVVAMRQAPAARDLLADEDANFSLLITDQTMPELSGVDLAHAAQSLRPNLPVLLYSGHADLIDVEALKRAGIRRVLRKPLEPAELRSAIEDCLGRA